MEMWGMWEGMWLTRKDKQTYTWKWVWRMDMLWRTPEKAEKNEEKYMKKDECTKTIKEPDIAKGVIEND